MTQDDANAAYIRHVLAQYAPHAEQRNPVVAFDHWRIAALVSAYAAARAEADAERQRREVATEVLRWLAHAGHAAYFGRIDPYGELSAALKKADQLLAADDATEAKP